MADVKEFYKKVSSFKDLRDAIKEVKKTALPQKQSKVEKAEPPKLSVVEDSKPKEDQPLKYLGRKKLIGGILSHMIGTGNEGDNNYQLDCHLEHHNKGIPSITITHVSPKGEILDRSPEYHKDMREAITSIVNHKMKKAWK